MADDRGLTQAETADRLRISTSWLRVLTDRGVIPRNDDGQYPWPASAEAYEEYQGGVDGSDDVDSLSEARLRKDLALAERYETEVRQRRGELVEREAVEAEHADLATRVRSHWLAWPGRVAADLAAELDVDAGRVSAALETHVRRSLDKLSDELDPADEEGEAA